MWDVFNPANAVDNLQTFFAAGGNVLIIIMAVTFVMWLMVLERILFFSTAGSSHRKRVEKNWAGRSDKTSWYAFAVRSKGISEVQQKTMSNLGVIKGIIAILPLLGLLGTVTGMVEVFDVMASTGSSNARLMAGGITKATIPTMAGLVASLSGIVMANIIEGLAEREVRSATHNIVIG